MVVRKVVAALCVAGSLAACQPSVPPAGPDPLPVRGLGVSYGHSPELIDEYETWLGRDVDVVMVYLLSRSQEDLLASAEQVTARFEGVAPDTMVFSTPLVLKDQDLGHVLRGRNDAMFRRLARILVQTGRGDDVVRLGWEFNLPGHLWTATEEWDRYARAFRRVVTTMRSVKGAEHLRFEWNLARGGQPVPDAAWPGDAFVDIVGIDIYDRTYGEVNRDPVVRWQGFVDGEPGLAWVADFARRHGKPLGFSEWGLSSRHPEGVEADNVYFIEQMHAFIETNDVAYSIYFERDTDFDHRLMLHYPKAADRYRELFAS